MDFPKPLSVKYLAKRFNAKLIGDKSVVATGINEIHKVRPGDITFSDVEKYFRRALESSASIVMLNQEAECPLGKAILVLDNPFSAYDELIAEYRPYKPIDQLIHPSARIHPTAVIEPGVIIGANSEVGADTFIEANVVIRDHCKIGDRVIIQSGSTIGTDAFYFHKEPGTLKKWTSGGRVIIEDDVYVGSNCTINKGVSGDTIIGKGTKIDCLVHIGHGAVVGKNCIVAAQVGISGKAIIGDNCHILGQAGIAPSLKVGDGVTIHPKAGVGKDLEEGKRYFGYPAQEWTQQWREIAALKKLPDIIKQLENNKSD